MFNKIIRPENMEYLLNTIADFDDYYIVAGGTDILVRLKAGMLEDFPLIDISKIQSLSKIIKEGEKIYIGSGITHQEIVDSSLIGEYFPCLSQACRTVGSLQIRNVATLAGNIANSSPAGDSIPALLCCNASLKILSNKGERIVFLKDFFIAPGKNILKHGEIISEIIIPAEKGKGIFLKNAQRKALAISKVSMAARRTENKFSFALGAVYKVPILAEKTMEYINSLNNIDDLEIKEAKKIILNECSPIDDIRSTNEYRQEIVGYFLEKAIKELTEI